MRAKRLKVIYGSVFIVFIMLFTQCSTERDSRDTPEMISVSILPQKYIVDMITGGKYPVNVMVPPGASPASYEPSPRQISGLNRSAVYFRIGQIIFEKTWIKNIMNENPGLKVVDLSENIEFLEEPEHENEPGGNTGHQHGNYDPHIWMSPANMRIISESVLKELESDFPGDSGLFRSNFKNLMDRINEIDSIFLADSVLLTGLNFLIYHPAMGYLARDYKMVQHVLEEEGKEPGTAHMARLIDEAKQNNIRYIFIQRQFNVENARTLARDLDAEIIEIDPLAENWYQEMKKIHNYLVKQ